MGYDCTLHAVDEKEIKGKFVRALLSGTKPPKGFTDDDSDLWNEALKSLGEDASDEAASTICQTAEVKFLSLANTNGIGENGYEWAASGRFFLYL